MRRLLIFVLLVFEPATLALVVSASLDRLVNRGPGAILLLVARLIVAGIGVAAGLALWRRRPGGVALARLAMALSLAAVLVTHLTHLWPGRLPPGLEGPALAALLVYYGGWLTWLLRLGSG